MSKQCCGSVPDNRRARRLYESEGWSDDDLRRDDEVFGVVVSQMRYRQLLVGAVGPARHAIRIARRGIPPRHAAHAPGQQPPTHTASVIAGKE